MMTPIGASEIAALDGGLFHVNLEPVYETVRRLRAKLPQETTLIGFCGAPWTVATYMIAGHGTADQAPTRIFAYREPEAFSRLLKVLADCSAAYLIRQIEAGADAVQIFDSWSGVLDEAAFADFCVAPVAEFVRQVRKVYPDVPIIGFPKGAGAHYEGYRQKTGVTGLGLDWTVPMASARALQRQGAVQGNLDPLRLTAGGAALSDGVSTILKELGGGPLIFNLGHGITPETPIAHVEVMVKMVRSAAR
jgi:uroporphyrinogen decarboxylase